MLRRSRPLIIALLVFPLIAVIACGGSQPPAEKPVAAPAPPPPRPITELTKEMHLQLGKVTIVQQAVIRGDLETAVEPAKWMAEHQESAGFPANTASYVADMKKLAAAVAGAKDIKGAATSTTMMISYCGQCHAAAKVTPVFPDLPRPRTTKGTAAHMLEHQWAVDLMYQGLAGPSDELWKKGVEALKAAPLSMKDLPRDASLTPEIAASEQKIHDQAEKALKTTDVGTRVALYSEVMGQCAACHSLHGRVWGPGLPIGK
jgi:cytochrome c556